MFRFADPVYFLLLIPLVLLAAWLWRPRPSASLLFSAGARLPQNRTTWRTFLLPWSPVLFLLGLAGIVLALARPQSFLQRTLKNTEAIAIQMVVDCSGSMEALDFSTRDEMKSRLSVVKETFARFIGRRTGDLIGLITFAGYASTRAPLTLDHPALLHVLNGVEVPQGIFDGSGRIMNEEEMLTAIGDGLATACARLEKTPQVKSRIVVLLSDGESNTGLIKPPQSIQIAKALGVKVYTIGIGTTGQAPFKVRDAFGRTAVQYGQVRIDEDLLRRIAQETGGSYFNVQDPLGLDRALAAIDKLEKTTIDSTVFNQYRELMAPVLAASLFLLAVALGLQVALRGEVI
jgi:Ca-activated chloride channel family protein